MKKNARGQSLNVVMAVPGAIRLKHRARPVTQQAGRNSKELATDADRAKFVVTFVKEYE